MAFIRAVTADQFACVDEQGKTVALGRLQVDLVDGGQRHGAVRFVSDAPTHESQARGLSVADADALARAQAGV
jgi:hypothetical protein